MRHSLLSLGVLGALLPGLPAAAEMALPALVIEASKLDKDSRTMTQSVSVIDEEEIRRGSYTNVTEVLRSLAGIEFKQAGGPGQYNYLRMRGFGAGHVLIVVDGVTLNQAGSGDIGHLLGQLDPAAISRIEVLRGPQTVLYGANATAGVIAITTKRGSGRQLSLAAEAGSLGWRKLKGNWQHQVAVGDGALHSSVYASKTDSDGVHRYEEFKDEELQFSLDYRSARFDAGLSFWHADNRFNFSQLTEVTRSGHPSYWANQMPDPHAWNDTRTRIAQAYIEHNINKQFSQRLSAGWTESRRKTLDRDDGLLGYVNAPWDGFTVDWMNFHNQGDWVPIHDDGSPDAAHYKDRSTQFDYSLRYGADGLKALAGVEFYESDARQWGRYGGLHGDADRRSVYLNAEYALAGSGLTLAGGLRHDDYDVWDNKTTGSLGANYQFDNFTLFANHGSSYRAPTLQELFNPNYGSTALSPETGRTSEIGFRQQLPGTGFSWEASAWHARLKKVIIYDASIANPSNPFGGFGQYVNADQQRTRGLELGFAWALDPAWTLRGNYTYTDSHTRAKGMGYEPTVLIARHKANLGAFYTRGAFSGGVNVYYTDARLDWTRRDQVDDYVRVDLSARYAVGHQATVYARIENLFDANISEGLGHKQPGTYGVVGLEYRFF